MERLNNNFNLLVLLHTSGGGFLIQAMVVVGSSVVPSGHTHWLPQWLGTEYGQFTSAKLP